MKQSRFKDISQALQRVDDLKDVADQVDIQGGFRQQIPKSMELERADTLGNVISKLKAKGGAVTRLANSPIAKKAALALGGPAAMALSTASDALASEDVGAGSDQIDDLQNEEALTNIPHENFADPEIREQARRWQKIKKAMER